jgi:hypothetical protein
MSDMSQAQGVSGGDPLDLVNATGTEDDVLPGAPEEVGGPGDDTGEDNDGVSGRAMDMVNADPAPEGGASLDPPGAEPPAPTSGVDPLQGSESGGDLESGADPMPDVSGTTPD